jgi:hypothetical protein
MAGYSVDIQRLGGRCVNNLTAENVHETQDCHVGTFAGFERNNNWTHLHAQQGSSRLEGSTKAVLQPKHKLCKEIFYF